MRRYQPGVGFHESATALARHLAASPDGLDDEDEMAKAKENFVEAGTKCFAGGAEGVPERFKRLGR
ncbi:hypothetical protein [Bradyrhizobium sp. B120]|uniref:hypothetical protein n=1 Tax=Bradyrhizobium sp. B120 TaxID=3410088 RepID=UPI003B984EB6